MPPKDLDVSAILSAVYQVRSDETDQIASRVRARVAALETIVECTRLLLNAPLFALGEMAASRSKTTENKG